jgi:hypothetical protein
VIKKVTRGKVAVFTTALDIAQTETKGTVLIKNADEMLNFTTGEEKHIEKVRHEITLTHPALTFFFQKDLQRDRRRRYQSHHRRIKHRRIVSTLPQPIQHRCPKSPFQI